MVGLNLQGVAKILQRLHMTVQILQGGAPVVQCLGKGRPDPERAVITVQRLCMAAQGPQGGAPIAQRFSVIRFEFQRMVETLQRLRRAFQRPQGIATVAQGLCVLRHGLQSTITAVQRFLRPVQVQQGGPTVTEHAGIVRMDLQCQLKKDNGLSRMVSLHRQRCQQLQRIKVPWLPLQNFLVQHFRLIELPLLMQGHSRLQFGVRGLR